MSQTTNQSNPVVAARADYLWCVRARLIDRSEEAWRDFVAGYLSMDKFVERRQPARAVA